ncbi:MAG: cytochrome c-type biogenesis CcmF C-terminal domain-containing protein [Polyangiaceae bacterium]
MSGFIAISITVGPPFFNRWAAPIGLLIFLLMGLAPLFGWRKTSTKALRRAFVFPIVVTTSTAIIHVAIGSKLGLPAFVSRDATSAGLFGVVLQRISSAAPAITVALAAFNVAVIAQEFFFGIRARRTAASSRNEPEGVFAAFRQLVAKSRRRYGGYIVHLGITAMYLGFVGTVWSTTTEVGLMPGESVNVAGYRLEYRGPRMCPGSPSCSQQEQSDTSKRMLFADLDVFKDGEKVTRLSPAKFIYSRGEGMTTTEVALLRSFGTDLYVVLGSADPSSKRAQLQIHGNPFVSWISGRDPRSRTRSQCVSVARSITRKTRSMGSRTSHGGGDDECRLGRSLGIEHDATRKSRLPRRAKPKIELVDPRRLASIRAERRGSPTMSGSRARSFLSEHPAMASVIGWMAISAGLLAYFGLATWIMFLAFSFLVLSLGLLWANVASLGEDRALTLEEALDLAAPARDEERKMSVLRGLKDLDYEHGLGKISDEDYRVLNQRYRQEARQLLERLDTSDATLRKRVIDAVEERVEESL